MISTSAVTEDGRDEVGPRPGRSPWGLFFAGLLVGTALGVITFAPRSTTPAVSTTVLAVAPEDQGPVGFAAQVPGFPDGLVAVVRSAGSAQELVVWPLAGEPIRSPLSVASPVPPPAVDFDAAGRRIASMFPGPDGLGGLLYAGAPESAGLVAYEVTGYVWHDSAPARLAYTTTTGGETFLWVAGGNQTRSELVMQAMGIEGGVVAYGDWGFALEDGNSIVLLTPLGEIKAFSPGRVLASHGDGWLVVVEGGRPLVVGVDGTMVALDGAGLESDEPVVAARFSPQGDRIALVTPSRLLVVARDGVPEMNPVFLRARVPARVRWSSDGTHVLVPGDRGIAVLTIATGGGRAVLDGELVTGVGVLPLTIP